MTIANLFAAATLVGTALLLGPPTSAQDETGRRETVRIADLDVSHAAGARAALARIRGAVARVCGPDPELMAWPSQRLHRACVDRSLREAVAEVDSAALSLVAGVHRTPGPYDIATADLARKRAAAR